MQRAKEAAQQFLHKAGQNDTTTHETVAPAVVEQTNRQHHHEHSQTAVDKEIHKDHHHTTVQPIVDRQVLPEKHEHHIAGTEHRHVDHGRNDVQGRLQQERSQFQNKTIDGGVHQTHESSAQLVGEHRHHHVHEVIQPVIHKETIQPEVHHKITPIHEVHREGAVHHGTTALPAVSLQQFQQQGGAIKGRETVVDSFQGEPQNIGNTTGVSGHHNGYDNAAHTGHATNTKPSLLQKLNPKTDTDGDGKRGVLE